MKSPKDTLILYIEDDVEAREVVADILHVHGYRHISASTGLEGIKLASREKPDLILMDIFLPDLQGYEVTTLLKSYPYLQKTPIIALTADIQKGARERTIIAGCDGYLSKPINVTEFLKKIEDFLVGKKETLSPEVEKKYLNEYKVLLVEKLQKKIQELEKSNTELSKTNEQLVLSRKQLTEYNNRLFYLNSLSNYLRLQTSPNALLHILPHKVIEGFGVERCIIFEYDPLAEKLVALFSAGMGQIVSKDLQINFTFDFYQEIRKQHKIIWIKNEHEIIDTNLKNISKKLETKSFILSSFSEQRKAQEDSNLYKKIDDLQELHKPEEQNISSSRMLIFLDRAKSGKQFQTYEVRIIKSFLQSTSIIYENMFLYHKLYDLYQIRQKEAITDALTGLNNYRYFKGEAEREILRSKRHDKYFSICMVDLDNFKNFNDTYGHPAGDQLLRTISEILLHNTRKSDIVARYGGDEFIIILPELLKDQAKSWSEKLLEKSRNSKELKHFKKSKIALTMSIGISSFPNDGETLSELVKKADDALYRSKNSGKNMVTIA